MQDAGLQPSTGYGRGLGDVQSSAGASHEIHFLECQGTLGKIAMREHAQGLMITRTLL